MRRTKGDLAPPSGAEYALSSRALRAFNAALHGSPEVDYPFHDKTVTVLASSR